jgi:hypothetical protein
MNKVQVPDDRARGQETWSPHYVFTLTDDDDFVVKILRQEADSLYNCQVIPRLLWNPKAYYYGPEAPIRPYIEPVESTTHLHILFLQGPLYYNPTYTYIPKWSLPLRFTD